MLPSSVGPPTCGRVSGLPECPGKSPIDMGTKYLNSEISDFSIRKARFFNVFVFISRRPQYTLVETQIEPHEAEI